MTLFSRRPLISAPSRNTTKPSSGHMTLPTTAAVAVKSATGAGAEIVGANCGTGLSLDDYVKLAEQLVAAAGQAKVIVQPNAGSPRTENGRTIYNATPEEMAATAIRLLTTGVRIIGGCCGTTPAHLAAMSRAVRAAKL